MVWLGKHIVPSMGEGEADMGPGIGKRGAKPLAWGGTLVREEGGYGEHTEPLAWGRLGGVAGSPGNRGGWQCGTQRGCGVECKEPLLYTMSLAYRSSEVCDPLPL